MTKVGCCAPTTRAGGRATDADSVVEPGAGSDRIDHSAESVKVPGGMGLVGTRNPGIPDDGENPLRRTRLQPFRLAKTAVTNAQFRVFAENTGYVTEAEKIGWSFVFWSDVPKDYGPTEAVQGIEWWRRVEGANWRDINGPGTEAEACHDTHPVVQVSWRDARAYASWVGGRLPTEAEWEHAARGGQGDVPFPWGAVRPNEHSDFRCNIWQGKFPEYNRATDGYATTAPVDAFAPNAFGLSNMVGNVWEWTADPYRIRSLKTGVKRRLSEMKGFKVLKGGSFLCHESYCYRYRIAARIGNSPDSATTHQGFRVAWSV